MQLIQLDQDKCVQCGLCVQVCPADYLAMGSKGPQEVEGKGCLACGHCVAVCPKEALDNAKAPLKNQVKAPAAPLLDADKAEIFLRSRRSIRRYKTESVPKEKIERLLNIARLAPTGGNTQGVSYLVIQDQETLKALTAATVRWMELLIEQKAPSAPYFKATVSKYRNTGADVILRGAPCLILAMAPKTSMPRGRDNTHFSLGYAELYAPSLGLGSCWTGFLEFCAASGYQPVLDILKLPEDMIVTGGLMVGVPGVKYQRFADRNPLQVSWR